jgi:hypothetical protein
MATKANLLQSFAQAFPGVYSGEKTLVIDDDQLEALLGVLGEFAAPNVECAMVASEDIPEVAYEGLGGFRKAWTDWLGGFERVRFRFERVLESEDALVMLATQIGTTRYDVELEQPSAMVTRFGASGKVERVEFHLDTDYALRSAGLDPQSIQVEPQSRVEPASPADPQSSQA